MSTVPTLREIDHVRGSVSASLLLMTYGSYPCPRSSEAHTAVQKLRESLGHHLCFVYRHFPQDDRYPRAFVAAEAAEAAGAQDKFWEMHDKLFDNSTALDDASIVEYADDVGVEIPTFLREISAHEYAERVQTDIDQGAEDGIQKTPTFFISVRHDGKEGLEPIVQQILNVVLSNSGAETRNFSD